MKDSDLILLNSRFSPNCIGRKNDPNFVPNENSLLDENEIEDLRDKNLRDKNLEDKNLKDKNLKDKNLKDKNLKDKNLKDKNLKDKNLKDKNPKNKNLKDKNLKDKNLKDKNLKDENPKNKNLKDKENDNPNDKNKNDDPNNDDPNNEDNLNFYKYMYNEPSSGQKWLVAILFGFLFLIISSPPFINLLSSISVSLGGISFLQGKGVNLVGLLITMIIFIIIVRIILW